jgi:hypothetical protein
VGFTPAGPAAGSMAASLMTYLGGQSGIAAGSAYAVAQSASIGGAATGIVATVGTMSVGTVLAASAVPVVVGGAAYYATRKYVGREKRCM